MNIVICDDDKNYREMLESKIKLAITDLFDFDYCIIGLNDLDELENHLNSNKIDILFLDVMFNGTNAIDWATTHLSNTNLQLVFITAYPVQAYNLFETKCVYFLIKSKFTSENLNSALKKCIDNITQKKTDVITVKNGVKTLTVDLRKVAFIESLNNNIMIHFIDNSNIMLYMTLKEFEKLLPIYYFHCHKSYIVNFNSVVGFEPHEFILSNNNRVPIPSRKYKKVVEHYRKYITNI